MEITSLNQIYNQFARSPIDLEDDDLFDIDLKQQALPPTRQQVTEGAACSATCASCQYTCGNCKSYQRVC